jgi:hypothetical protein
MKLLLPLLLVICSACSSIEAFSDQDPDTDFASYRTFVLGSPPAEAPEGLPNYSAIAGERINRQIATNLESKGLREVPADEADILVSFQLAGEQRSEIRSTGPNSSLYYPSYDRWYGVGWYDHNLYTVNYVIGTLIIDVFDRTEEKLVWHGWSSTGIYDQSNQQDKAKAVLEALLKLYPPQ